MCEIVVWFDVVLCFSQRWKIGEFNLVPYHLKETKFTFAADGLNMGQKTELNHLIIEPKTLFDGIIG